MAKTETKGEEQALVVFNRGNVSGLPAAVQKAIERSGIKTRELAGVAPSWKPEDPGTYIIGEVIAIRENLGEFAGSCIVLMTDKGPQSVWLGADLKTKLGQSVRVGQYYCIVYDGKLAKKDNPKLKNDMHLYKVVELLDPAK